MQLIKYVIYIYIKYVIYILYYSISYIYNIYITYYINQGSDKEGEVVQWHLVGTKRNA